MASSVHTGYAEPTACPQRSVTARGAILVRLRGAFMAGACLAAIALGASLTPRAAGHGTHEQLGLPACSFLVRTGLPCPSCGLTTSFSAAFHGQLALAWRAQPFGLVLAALMVLLAAAGLVELAIGRDLMRRVRPRLWWLAAGVGLMLGGWALKLAWMGAPQAG